MTATAPPRLRLEIVNTVDMRQPVFERVILSARPAFSFNVGQFTSFKEDVEAPLELMFLHQSDDVALIYCTTVREASRMYRHLIRRFARELQEPVEEEAEHKASETEHPRLGFYAAVSSEAHRGETVRLFKDGKLRVVIATSAFGMYGFFVVVIRHYPD
jgi:superfamily II DNA helicase RecQ